MKWLVFFYAAVVVLSVTILLAAIKALFASNVYKKITPARILFVGIFIGSMLLFIPFYHEYFGNQDFSWLKAAFMTFYNAIGIFSRGANFNLIITNQSDMNEWLRSAYSALTVAMVTLCPFFTLGFVLSFFNNISAFYRYIASYHKDVYIFSELNERTIALARSLVDNDKGLAIVFTGISDNGLYKEAKSIDAICFKKKAEQINFRFHNKGKPITFVVISENDVDTNAQGLEIISKYSSKQNVSLFIADTGIESELLLNSVPKGNMKVRRINEIRSLISRTLYDMGNEIFEGAVETESENKLISAVVIGLGQYGSEMTRALSWFCQMEGYDVVINSFEKNSAAVSAFEATCPELLAPEYNGNFDNYGEARYRINLHSGVEVGTKEFSSIFTSLRDVTYIFVATGNDEKNIEIAALMRSLSEKCGYSPVIKAVVYSSDKKSALGSIKNAKGQSYNIDFIGDLNSAYSKEVIFCSDVEKDALHRHLKWGSEEDFWNFEYNYRSSVASAIHKKMKLGCGVPGVDKDADMRNETERSILRMLEHRRWNAYMRSEGYTYSEKRNDLAKTHNCLVSFEKLSLAEQEKDDD